MLDAGEQIGSQTLGRSRRSHVPHAADQFVEHHAQLESGKIRTNTEMLTVAERDVVVGLAREVEAVGIREHLLVTIGGWVPDDHPVPFLNRSSAQLRRARRGTHNMSD